MISLIMITITNIYIISINFYYFVTLFEMAANMKRRYGQCMRMFLGHIGTDLPLELVLARDIPADLLLSIKPEQIVDYFNMRAYGKTEVLDEDRPVLTRSSTLFFYKKALLSYMYNGNSHWDDVLNRGNPTKSKEVNNMIKKVIKHEVRHQGVSSKARRAFEFKEFLQLAKLMRKKGFKRNVSLAESMRWCRLTALLNLQWQLMARMDDMLNLKFETITTNLVFPFSLNVKMRWSKNITEERDAPEQVVLGSFEEMICPLLNLAMYIEGSGFTGETLTKDGFLFGGTAARHSVRRLFDSLIQDEEFTALLAGLLGNHSVRKGSATFAMRSGLSRDHTNRRGRWRVRKQVVDAYIEINLPYPDALAAHKLCGSKGSCRYRPQVDLTDSFILEKIVPNCQRLLGDPAALPLGHALLWAAFQDKFHHDEEFPLIPPNLRDQVVAAYETQYGSIEAQNKDNPIKRVGIVPQGTGDQVTMIEIDYEEDEDAATVRRNTNNLSSTSGGLSSDVAAPLLAHQMTVQREIQDVKTQVLQQLFEMRSQHERQYSIITRNIKRIALQPVVRRSNLLPRVVDTQGTQGQNEEEQKEEDDEELAMLLIRRRPAKLYKSPKTLFDVWQEYQFGINGEKPAKDFTHEERGKNKCMYCRRKVFWDVVSNLVRAGHTSDVAIDKVYQAYGRSTSVTRILVQMVRQRKDGGHPSLRV